MKKSILCAMLAVSLIAALPVAEARGHGYWHHGYGWRGPDAVAAGLLGLGIGLALAPRSYYRSETIYEDTPVVIERRYVVPERRIYYRDRDYYERDGDDDY